MKHWMIMAAMLLISSGVVTLADEKVTVEATSEDISEGLDLKAVATLFGEVKNLNEFEERLNAEDTHISNLDLNGDGKVDYLRVIEVTGENDSHLVIIQAVLAKDIYQDIASIYVEKNADQSVTVQVIGDAYIYGSNYVIEPVYIYRPVIYDWFWGPGWVCYSSPWYWGYWPGWYAPYPCWGCRDYWVHVHVYHYDHAICSYRYAREPHYKAAQIYDPVSRSDYARAHASSSFSSRTGASNAREYNSATRTSSSRASNSVVRTTSASNTFGSRNTASNIRVSSTNSSSSARTSSATASSSRSSSYGSSYSSNYSGSYGSSSRSSSYSGSSNSSYSGSSSTRNSSVSSSATSNNYSSGRSSSYSASSSNYSSSAGRSSSSSYSGGGSSYSGGGSRGASSSMSSGASSGRR